MSFVTKTTTSKDALGQLYRVLNGLEAANGLYVRETDSSSSSTTTTKTTGLSSSLSDTNMPSLTSLGSSSSSSSSSSGSSGANSDMPSLSSSSTSSTSSSSTSSLYTTPSVTVPPSDNNPYISRTSNINGTVFIALGAIVGAILLSFIAWHIINSYLASRATKKGGYFKTSGNTTARFSENFAAMDNPGYNSNFLPSVSKLPLLLNHGGGHSRNLLGPSSVFGFGGLQTGDTSTIYQLDNVSKNDMTRMFISPTADVLAQKRSSRIIPNSFTHLPLGNNGSNPTLQTPNRGVPNIYMSPDHTELEFLVMMGSPQQRANPGRAGNLKIPSMVLDDLIGEEGEGR